MKKLLCIATLLTIAVYAAYPSFTFDVNQDFESSLSGIWAEDDTSSILTPQSTNQKYRGTYAAEVAANSTAWADVHVTLAAPANSLSVGFWYRSGAYANYSGDRMVARTYNDAQGATGIIREGRDAGDNSRRMVLSIGSGSIALSDSTWYWVTYQHVKNATCSLAVYDTTGTQVGSTITGTSGDYATNSMHFGTYSVASTVATYFDEIHIDTTDATFPLGPPSEGSASRRNRFSIQ